MDGTGRTIEREALTYSTEGETGQLVFNTSRTISITRAYACLLYFCRCRLSSPSASPNPGFGRSLFRCTFPPTCPSPLVMRPPLSGVWPCLRARMGRDPFELVVCVASS
jgi:hypothetical protein